jgi:hypothetical protein
LVQFPVPLSFLFAMPAMKPRLDELTAELALFERPIETSFPAY